MALVARGLDGGKTALNAAGELLFLEDLWLRGSLAGNIPRKPSGHNSGSSAGCCGEGSGLAGRKAAPRGCRGAAVPGKPCRARGEPCHAVPREQPRQAATVKPVCKKSSVLNKMTTEL